LVEILPHLQEDKLWHRYLPSSGKSALFTRHCLPWIAIQYYTNTGNQAALL